MKFDFCIGNPPYQDSTKGDNETYAPPVYDKFMDSAYGIADKVELIHPARFLFDAGSTPKEWNHKILNDEHFKVLKYEEDCKKIFANTEIKGGIAITYHDTKKNFGAIEIFTPSELLNDILKKVANDNNFSSMTEIVFTRTAYRLTDKMHQDYPDAIKMLSKGHAYDMSSNIFDRLPMIFYDNKPNDGNEYLKILGRENNNRAFKYIKKEYVRETKNTYSYKVIIPQASGSGEFGETISSPDIGAPGEATTETFITIGIFESEEEANNCKKYVATKFLRAMLGVLKRTQALSPDKWKYIPMQNFNVDSDINWNLSINQIDLQLYRKYNLTQDEINFIETNVKEME